MKQHVYLFIGQSGAGKGTQAALLAEKIHHLDPTRPCMRLETGKGFRELIEQDHFIARQAKAMIAQGKLPPSFLGIHVWSTEIMKHYTGNQHVFVDGTPRILDEVAPLISLFEFLDWYPHVINIEVSDESSHDRLIKRGRVDDTKESEVWGRIQWFHESVVPALERLKESPRIQFHTIQGEQSIEEVHHDICVAIGLD